MSHMHTPILRILPDCRATVKPCIGLSIRTIRGPPGIALATPGNSWSTPPAAPSWPASPTSHQGTKPGVRGPLLLVSLCLGGLRPHLDSSLLKSASIRVICGPYRPLLPRSPRVPRFGSSPCPSACLMPSLSHDKQVRHGEGWDPACRAEASAKAGTRCSPIPLFSGAQCRVMEG